MTGSPHPPSTSAPRGAGARWWLVLALVLALVIAAAVVAVHVVFARRDTDGAPPSLPTPAPWAGPATPPASAGSGTPSTTPPQVDPGLPVVIRAGPGPLVPGATGQVYAESATAIFRIELATGRITRTATPELREHVTFLAGRDWVLVKSRWSPTGIVVHDGRPATPLPRQFDPEGMLHAGPGGRLWVEPEWGTNPTPTTVVRLSEFDGRPVADRVVTVPGNRAPYAIEADGSGGLLMTNRGGIYQLSPDRPGSPSPVRLLARGDLIALDGRRLLVWDCDASGRCSLDLLDRRTGHRTARPAAARTLLAEDGPGIETIDHTDTLLSPDGSHVAFTTQDGSGTFRVHVIDLSTGHDVVLPGAGTDANANRQLAWSANSRWLLALTDHRLRSYDTRTGSILTPAVDEAPLLHLTSAGAAGW